MTNQSQLLATLYDDAFDAFAELGAVYDGVYLATPGSLPVPCTVLRSTSVQEVGDYAGGSAAVVEFTIRRIQVPAPAVNGTFTVDADNSVWVLERLLREDEGATVWVVGRG